MNKPNVVWVLTDDQNWGSLGCGGNPQMITPNIDNFYNNSISMSDYHVGPTCAPTRSSLMTGRYANSTGVWHTVGGRSLLREDEWTVADAFSENGYETGIFGKWHLGDTSPYLPQDRGFKKTVIHGGGGISQTPDFWGNDYFDDVYLTDGVYKQYKGYCTDVFFEEAEKFIEENKEKPFFCYIPTNAPHAPLNVPKKYKDMYKDLDISNGRKRYFGMVSCIDENFGRLMDKLKKLNLLENTIIIFMTDNGTGRVTLNLDADDFVVEGYNGGLRGCKGSEYDGGHRVPFLMQYLNKNYVGGREVSELTSCIDVMPTLMDLCNIDTKGHTFHGKSLVPLIDGDTTDFEDRVVVTDSQRLTNPQKWRQSSTMTSKWRLINGAELYNAKSDREQRNNIAWKHPDVVKRLRTEYDKWWDIVSVRFDEMIPQHINGKNQVRFIPHDFRSMSNDYAYNQGDIRCGKITSGYWEVTIDEPGDYIFSLYRWPKEINYNICQGITDENPDVVFDEEGIQPGKEKNYKGGVALNITSAHLQIQEYNLEHAVTKDDRDIEFEVNLEKGPCTMKAWFGADKVKYPVYYLYVNKKEQNNE